MRINIGIERTISGKGRGRKYEHKNVQASLDAENFAALNHEQVKAWVGEHWPGWWICGYCEAGRE